MYVNEEAVYTEIEPQVVSENTYDNGYVPTPQQTMPAERTCTTLLYKVKDTCFGSRKRIIISVAVLIMLLILLFVIVPVAVTAGKKGSSSQGDSVQGKCFNSIRKLTLHHTLSQSHPHWN